MRTLGYRKRLAIVGLAATALTGGTALTADSGSGFYVGGSVGETREQFDAGTFYAGSSSTGYEVAVGYRPLTVLAAELNYVGFPRASKGVNYADTDGVGAFALGYVPIPVVSVFGKVGVLDWRTNAQSPLFSFHRTGANLAYGVGASTSFGRLAARLQFEQFDVVHATTMNLTSIGLTWAL